MKFPVQRSMSGHRPPHPVIRPTDRSPGAVMRERTPAQRRREADQAHAAGPMAPGARASSESQDQPDLPFYDPVPSVCTENGLMGLPPRASHFLNGTWTKSADAPDVRSRSVSNQSRSVSATSLP